MIDGLSVAIVLPYLFLFISIPDAQDILFIYLWCLDIVSVTTMCGLPWWNNSDLSSPLWTYQELDA
jgi:hypothetical protein